MHLADGDRIGWALLRPGDDTAEMTDAVAAQAATACSRALLRRRARSEALEQVPWDLLQGPVEHRIAGAGAVAGRPARPRSRGQRSAP